MSDPLDNIAFEAWSSVGKNLAPSDAERAAINAPDVIRTALRSEMRRWANVERVLEEMDRRVLLYVGISIFVVTGVVLKPSEPL